MNKTSIEWTDFTANPIKFRDAGGKTVWACVHASPGCQHCYAETLAKRYGRGGPFNVPTTAKLTPFLDEKELRSMRTYKPANGKRCFIGDMTDLFGDWVSDDLLNELFSNVLEVRTDVTWQILTKRADRLQRYLSWRWARRIPSRHIWIGVSCEDQQRADERIPLLLQTPATVRFISAEPLLGPIDLAELPSRFDIGDGDGVCNRPLMRLDALRGRHSCGPALGPDTEHLDWVIVGGESGPRARECAIQWIRQIIEDASIAGVPCFVKQLGSKPINLGYGERQIRSSDRKGGDIHQFPPDLRLREWPCARAGASV